ncbi:MAG: hypothetical protein A4E55_00764 [Pelotomaculum sp. PtaU1.Bin035]|nr:MAG: hypothetical protein A4E55_00764 [Pelotomaculum sp. PtaU1.Bin035]
MYQDILQKLSGVKKCQDGFIAQCPAHDDQRQSLSINQTNDGKILMKCHAGCAIQDIVSSLGLKMKDLFPPREEKPSKLKRQIVAEYNYLDANGKLVFQAIRFSPKSFSQRQPNGQGGWNWNLKGVELVPYKLPEILEAMKNGEVIYIPEGEKDVDRLVSLGLTATCNSSGAGKWRDKYHSKYFVSGAKVVVLPDNDPQGQKHAQEIAAQLVKRGCKVKILKLPDLPPKGDVSDWLNAGHSKDELLKLVKKTEMLQETDLELKINQEPITNKKYYSSSQVFSLTDIGNGERLANLFGNDIRYCFKWRKWLIWNGKQWEVDDGDKIQALAKHTVRQIYKEASNVKDDERREKIVEWGLRSESSQKVKAMIERACSEPGIPIKTESLDSNKWLLNVLNGTIDLKTGELKPHQRTDYMTKIAPVEYDPNAVCPIWLNFLYEIMNGNQILVDFLQKAIGYSATGDTSEQIIFFLYGVGANGKSTFLNVISDIFGDYAMNAPTDMLMKKKSGGVSNDIARLRGTRFISAVESEEGRQLAEVLIKQLTGEDKIAARFLFQEYFEFKPEGKIFLATNAKPVIKGDDYGIWRRVRLVPFEVIFTHEKQDKKLPEKLKAEYPGILKWVIDGCLEWQKSGLEIPEKVLTATEEYRKEMDSVANFLEECCNTSIKDAKAASGELYNLYTTWCYANDEEPLTQKKVAKRLEKMGFMKERGTGGRYYWHGLGILTSIKDGSEPFEPFEGKMVYLPRDTKYKGNYADYRSNHSKGSLKQEILSANDDEDRWE